MIIRSEDEVQLLSPDCYGAFFGSIWKLYKRRDCKGLFAKDVMIKQKHYRNVDKGESIAKTYEGDTLIVFVIDVIRHYGENCAI